MIIKYQNERKFMVFEKNRKNENEKFEIQRRTGTKSELRNSKLAPNWWCTINLTPSPLTHSTTQIPFVLEIPLRCSRVLMGFYGVFISEKFLWQFFIWISLFRYGLNIFVYILLKWHGSHGSHDDSYWWVTWVTWTGDHVIHLNKRKWLSEEGDTWFMAMNLFCLFLFVFWLA